MHGSKERLHIGAANIMALVHFAAVKTVSECNPKKAFGPVASVGEAATLSPMQWKAGG